MSDAKTEGGSAPSLNVPLTPEERVRKLPHNPSDWAIADAIRAAEAEGRAAALGEMVRKAHEYASEARGSACDTERWFLQFAEEIRSLLNQGRDEVAPSHSPVSPEKEK